MNEKERINEIARMISGENITEKSLKFSKELLTNSNI
jgi:DNA repair ATPase RecN